MRRFLPLLVVALVAACGPSGASGSPGRQSVVVGFYPLQYATERVGGARVDVRNLAGSGVEPHDLELTPGDVGELSDADLVVSLPGFQPALDDAVAQAGVPDLDVTAVVKADRSYTPEAGAAVRDPHVWLDPMRMADLGDGIAERLSTLDPGGREVYRAGSAALRSDMEQLDADFRSGLQDCRSRAIVTSHYAFGYLADRYDLEQVSLSGLRPDSEPSPAELSSLVSYIREHSVTTVYAEVLGSNAIDRTVAAETGAKVAVLDPIEGVTDASAARDYPGLMRANLTTLREGLGCR